jgi:hypothetical protein
VFQQEFPLEPTEGIALLMVLAAVLKVGEVELPLLLALAVLY